MSRFKLKNRILLEYMSRAMRGRATGLHPSAGWLMGALVVMIPSAAHACTGDSVFHFFTLIPYVIIFPLLWMLKIAIYALAGEGWLFKRLVGAGGLQMLAGAAVAVVSLPSMPYFTVAMIFIFTIFAYTDLKFFRAKYESRPPMRVRHALFWGNILVSLLLLGGLVFLSAAKQVC